MKGNVREDPRAAALASLLACERDGRYANLEINTSLNRSRMNESDRRLYTALVYGVIERTLTLDRIIGQYSSRQPEEMDREVLMLLRLGLYQLTYMDRIPPHAAVNECVSLAGSKAGGYVNAVLRAYLRADRRWDLPPETEPLERLSVRYSCPREICGLWLTQYGREEAELLLASTLRTPRLSLRVNTRKTTSEALREKLLAKGVETAPSALARDILCVEDGRSPLPDEDGEWFVEDEASRLAVQALGPRPGETVADVCAAPGGKTFSAAMDMEDRGRVFAFDLHANKLPLILRGAQRLGLSIVTAEARDARTPREDLIGRADRVLCDAPCSGLGVIAKKPDVKYRNMDAVRGLPAVQAGILRGAAAYVRPGGRLVYSTCTLNRAENEDVVSAFLAEHPAFHPADPGIRVGRRTGDGMVSLLPFADGCDGFFIAAMEKES